MIDNGKIILRGGINLDGELLTSLPSDPDALYMQNVRLHIHMIYLRKIMCNVSYVIFMGYG